VFRNDTARAYVTAYARACLYVGDVFKSATLALALSARNWPLVQAKEASAGEVPVDKQQKFERVYVESSPPYLPVNTGVPVALRTSSLHVKNSQLVRIQFERAVGMSGGDRGELLSVLARRSGCQPMKYCR